MELVTRPCRALSLHRVRGTRTNTLNCWQPDAALVCELSKQFAAGVGLQQVWSAKLQTDRGPVLRVWEFDRLNKTTWQVDMLLEDGVLWAHPKITNPNDHDIPGYWWTCVAMRTKPTTRVLAPADLSEFPCTPWPYGAHLLQNVTFRGPAFADGRPRTWLQDMSFIGNIPGPHDFFMHKAGINTSWPMPDGSRGAQPYIALTQPDGHSVIHGHPLNGTKFFTCVSNCTETIALDCVFC